MGRLPDSPRSSRGGIVTAIRGVLFDNDGTLVDTHDLILDSMRHATREVLGCTLSDEVLMAKVGQPLAVQVRDFTDDAAVQEEWLAVYREYNHRCHDERVRAFPGVRECLETLAEAGLKLGVVTSKLHALAWHGLEVCGLDPYLSVCIGSDDCDRFKPDPQPVVRGLEALGLAAGECPYVGDSPFDLQAGRGAGCSTAAVTWGMFPCGVLEAECPDVVCDDPAELSGWVLDR